MLRGELHRILQAESVSILAQTFGAGRSIWIPDSTASPAAKRLEILIGLAETAQLINHFGGGAVYLPGLSPKGQPIPGLTLARVKRLTDRRMSAAQIASLHGCSARTIYAKRSALKRMEEETQNDQAD